jgi:hypothetical protein
VQFQTHEQPSAWGFLFGRLHDLDVMVIEQVSGCMVELRNGQLEIDLSLDEV